MTELSTKEKILFTSLDLFSQYGYDGTSVRQISGAVGIRESAIYNHFSSKKKIFIELIEKYNKTSAGVNIINDDLLEDLSNPFLFMSHFTQKLITQWNSLEERKFIRLLQIEQFRKTQDLEFSFIKYLDEAKSIWWMIFDELIKHKIIINKFEPMLLADEFLVPIFMLRLELMTGDINENMEEVSERSRKHLDYFWHSIKN